MKKVIFLFVLIILLSCSEKKKTALIKVESDKIDFIEVISPIDDIILWNSKTDTIYPNEQNEFSFTKEIEQPEFIIVKIGKQRLKTILTPNSTVEIKDLDSTHVFQGKNKLGLEFLNTFKEPFFTFSESKKYLNDSTALQIKQKINSFKQVDLKTLNNLIEQDAVDELFSKTLEKEIDYFYALRTLQIILSKKYNKQFQEVPIKEELLTLYDSISEQYPLETSYKTISWKDFSRMILIEKPTYDAIKSGTITNKELREFYTNDKLHEYNYSLIKNYPIKSVKEKFLASYLMKSCKQDKFEKSLINIYNDFKKTFPNSNYLEYLAPEISKIENYYEKIAGDMPKSVKFIDGEKVASLDVLINKINGEKYYVDIWATWCHPCKAEFKHNEELDKLLESKGYKKLYISIDKPEKLKKWEQDIKYFNLKGTHFLASTSFKDDFAQKYTQNKGYFTIPQYLIIDENGKLITNDAPRPSNLEELKKVL